MDRYLEWTAAEAYPRTRAAMLQYQQRYLRKLLRYVWDRSAFYREYYASHGIDEGKLSEVSVSDLPLLSKKTLIDNFDRAVTDPRLQKKRWNNGWRAREARTRPSTRTRS